MSVDCLLAYFARVKSRTDRAKRDRLAFTV